MEAPVSLRDFDGLRARAIFCLWTGDELMSENRLAALWSVFANTGCPVAFLTKRTIDAWVLPEHPLHPAWPHLSSTHKSDYLRCYLMHHFGGGYTDIKRTTRPWGGFFDRLASSDKTALGYRELAHGIPHLNGPLGDTVRAAHGELIGLCAFILKRRSPLTSAWLARVEAILDEKLDELRLHPACHPLDRNGITLPDGTPSPYPLRWAEILGEVFHPLIYDLRADLLQDAIEPVFANYR